MATFAEQVAYFNELSTRYKLQVIASLTETMQGFRVKLSQILELSETLKIRTLAFVNGMRAWASLAMQRSMAGFTNAYHASIAFCKELPAWLMRKAEWVRSNVVKGFWWAYNTMCLLFSSIWNFSVKCLMFMRDTLNQIPQFMADTFHYMIKMIKRAWQFIKSIPHYIGRFLNTMVHFAREASRATWEALKLLANKGLLLIKSVYNLAYEGVSRCASMISSMISKCFWDIASKLQTGLGVIVGVSAALVDLSIDLLAWTFKSTIGRVVPSVPLVSSIAYSWPVKALLTAGVSLAVLGALITATYRLFKVVNPWAAAVAVPAGVYAATAAIERQAELHVAPLQHLAVDVQEANPVVQDTHEQSPAPVTHAFRVARENPDLGDAAPDTTPVRRSMRLQGI